MRNGPLLVLAVQARGNPVVERKGVPGEPPARPQGGGDTLEGAAAVSPSGQVQQCAERTVDQRRRLIERRRSGLAWASCSSSHPETSMLGPAAIVWLLILEIFGRNSKRITRWPSSRHEATPTSKNFATTSADATPMDLVMSPCSPSVSSRSPQGRGNGRVRHPSATGHISCTHSPSSAPRRRAVCVAAITRPHRAQTLPGAWAA